MPLPFLLIGPAFAAGVVLADLGAFGPAFSVPALAAALASAWLFWLKKKSAPALAALLSAVVVLGLLRASDVEARFAGHPLKGVPPGAAVDFFGRLDGSLSPGPERDAFPLLVDKAVFRNRTIAARGRIRISVPRSREFPRRLDLLVGDRLKVSAQIVPPREYLNFAEPFSRRYLLAQGLDAVAAAKSPLLVEKLSAGAAWSPRRWISRIRRACLRTIERHFSDSAVPGRLGREGAVFEALLLGERARLDDEVNLSLQATGLYHLLAISGAHIGIIAAMIFGLLQAVRIPRRAVFALMIVILAAYSFLVEGRASVVRASVMAMLYFAGRLLWKDVRLLNTLGLSALIILFDNPFQLYDMGFVLTYAATLAILLLTPPILRRLPRLPLKIGETMALSLSAQLGVLPLVASAFHRVAFSGLALNILAVPIISLIMAAGYLFLPLAALWPGAAAPAASALRVGIRAFLGSTHLLDGVKFLSYRLPGPPVWASLGYFAALLILLPARFKPFRPAAAALAFLFFILIILHPFPPESGDFRVTFLDVGQGDSILVEFPGAAAMLVDGGGLPTGRFDIGENVVSPFLWSKSLRRIDILVLTHAHPDHLGGLAAVARNFAIGEFWRAGAGAGSAAEEALDRALGQVPKVRLERGFRRTVRGVDIEALHPPAGPDEGGTENDRSLVLKLSRADRSVLLTGDITAASEGVLLGDPARLRAEVLKSPHHGSRSSSSEGFLNAVAPGVIVVSVGSPNSYGLPDPGVMERYRRRGAAVFRTDEHGAVEIAMSPAGLKIRTARKAG